MRPSHFANRTEKAKQHCSPYVHYEFNDMKVLVYDTIDTTVGTLHRAGLQSLQTHANFKFDKPVKRAMLASESLMVAYEQLPERQSGVCLRNAQ